MRKFYICLCVLPLVFITSCKQRSVEKSLLSLINVQNDKRNIIILIRDTDCSLCFERFINYRNGEKSCFHGFYYSTNPLLFLEKLNKINPTLNWQTLPNTKILNLIESRYGRHGPYEFMVLGDNLVLQ